MKVQSEADNAFGVYRTSLWLVGVWPLEERNYFKMFRYILATIFQVSLAMHSMTELYLNNGKMSDMVDILLFFASALLAITKHIFLNIHGGKIAETLKCYVKDWSDIKDVTSLKIMKAHVKIYKYQHIVYNSVGYIGTTLFLIRTILLNFLNEGQLGPNEEIEYKLISHTSYVSQEFLTKYYIILIMIQYVQFMYVCTCGASTDCFFFGLVFHLCAQFEILKSEWQKLGVDDFNNKNAINALIIKHQQLIKLGKNLEESFNGVVLLQLLISIILICMSGCSILVAMMVKDYMTILLSTNCISFMISESFIYAYASDYLLNQSESIVQAVYSSGWFNLENRLKRNFIFIIMKAQNPVYITAGKFFHITRNTAIQLLKSTFSYISVLRLTIEVSHTDT